MKRLGIVSVIILAIALFLSFGNVNDSISDNNQVVISKVDFGTLNSNLVDIEIQKRGCCSWHGGVCGCSNGRVLCCDGTLSPTCTCE